MRAGGRSRRIASACVLAVGMVAPAAAQAAPDELGKPFVPGEVIVGFEASANRDARASARAAVDASVEHRLLLPRTQLLEIPPGESVRAAIEELERRASVRYAEPNGIVRADVIPDDGGFVQQWGLHNTGQQVPPTGPPTPISGTPDADIDAPEAWDLETGDGGSTGPVVAVVDGGVMYDHTELGDNIWSNPGEAGGTPDFDDDGNGLVDDVRGWDFVTNDPGDPDDSDGPTGSADGADNDPMDLNGHGTHVAGIVGAEGDNGTTNGPAGVAWDARIMPVRALGVAGAGTTAQIANAFTYAADEGADIVNASLSGAGAAPQAIADAITGAPNTLFVVAAGNLSQDNDVGGGRYPCNVASANVICVAASDLDDELSSFSNFGSTSVDLAAPGTRIFSTYSRQAGPLPLAEDFDPDPAWTTGGANDTWAVTSENGPIGMPPTSLTDSPGANYVASTDSFARSPAIDLDPGTRCALTYSVELDMNADASGDAARVLTSPDGATFTPVHSFVGATPRADLGVDLTTFDGDAEMYFRFGLVSDADATVDNGAWFDNAVVDCGGNTLTFLDGTSMATPMVAGVAALGLSTNPAASVAQLRSALLNGVDTKPGLAGKVVTGGRLNARDTLLLLQTEPADWNVVHVPPGDPGIPPHVELSGKKKQRVGRKLTVDVRCTEPACTVRATATLKAGGDRMTLKARPSELVLNGPDPQTLKLKLSRAAREAATDALKDEETATAKVTVTATDPTGLTDQARRKIKLKD